MSAEWLQWYYLIYLLPAGVAVLVLLMTGVSGHLGSHAHAGHGGPHLHAHHGNLDTHVAGQHSGHAGAHHPAAAGHGQTRGPHGRLHDQSTQRTAGPGQQLLGFFGIGRAPLTIVIGSMMIGWGLVGMAVTDTLHGLRWPPVLFVGPALAAAAAGSLVFAKLFGELSARLMPRDESYAIGREGLLGLTGRVVYPVTESGGRVHLFDQFRTLHVKPARVGPGQAPIEKGTEVIVASIDPERGTLIVEPLGFSRSATSEHRTGIRNQSLDAEQAGELELRNRES